MTSVHVPAVWAIKIPPRVHFFLWLLSKNKLLTRDNLSIRRKVEDPSCLFCSEAKSIQHLFFECVVAKQLWAVKSEVLNRQVGSDFISVGTLWLSNKKFVIANSFCAAALWGFWKARNSLCFQGHPWKDGRVLLLTVTTMLQLELAMSQGECDRVYKMSGKKPYFVWFSATFRMYSASEGVLTCI